MCVFEMRRGTCNESETEKFLRNRKIESCEEKTQPYGKADIQDMQKKKQPKTIANSRGATLRVFCTQKKQKFKAERAPHRGLVGLPLRKQSRVSTSAQIPQQARPPTHRNCECRILGSRVTAESG